MASDLPPPAISGRTTINIKTETRDLLKATGKTYDEAVHQFANAGQVSSSETLPALTSPGNLTKKSGRTEGAVFISNTGTAFISPSITPQKIKEMLQNVYVQSELTNRFLVSYPNPVKVEALNPQQDIDEAMTHHLQNMIEAAEVRLSERVKQADGDSYNWGMGAFNPVWMRKGNEVYLAKLRHLPAWSFDQAPTSVSLMETWSDLLQGVVLNENGQPEYWQRQSSYTLDPVKIENVLIVRNPQDEGLAGDSKLVPLCQIAEMLKYCWNIEMQAANRAGAPIFFIKITEPQDACAENGWVSDVTYANMIIKNWSKNKQFVLRENMEIISLDIGQQVEVLPMIEVLKSIIEDYFSISKMISKDGTLIGGSSGPELQLLNQAIKGRHAWLLSPFEDLLNQYFTMNGFPEGWTVRLSIELNEPDRTEDKIKQAEIVISGQCGDLDDLRALLPDLEPADDEKKKSIAEFWAKVNQPTQAPALIEEKTEEAEEEEEPAQMTNMRAIQNKKEEKKETTAEEIITEVSEEMDAELDKLAAEIYGTLEAEA